MQNYREFVDEYREFPWDDLERLQQARGLYRRMQYQQAKEIYEDIAGKYSGTPLAENAELGLIGAEVHLTGDFETGMEELDDYMDKYPGSVGESEATRIAEFWEDVLRMLDRIEADSEDYGTHSQLGFFLRRGGYMPMADQHFLEAAKDTTDDTAFMGLGYVYSRTGRTEESISNFERYLQNHPDNGNIFNQVGYAYLGMGQLENALECFKKYMEIEPDNPNTHDSYAECLLSMGKLDEAITEYQKAIEINAGFTNPYFMLGRAHVQKADAEKALEYYGKYLELDPHGFQAAQAQTQIDSLNQK